MIGERESDSQPGAAVATVRSLNRPAMNAHDSFDERQSQAVSGRVSPLHTTLKDLREDLRFEARPVVFHDEYCGIFRATETNCDGACGRQMLQFIVEKVGDHAMEESSVRRDFKPTRTA